MLQNLKTMLAEASASERRINEINRSLSDIILKKEKAVAEATGPDDEKAMDRLNVYASQESICHSQLRIANREVEGIKLRVLNEAMHVRRAVMETLTEVRDRQIARLDAKLEEFYPSAHDRKNVIQHLTAGAGIVQVPYITELGKSNVSLAYNPFNQRETTEIKWAKHILIEAQNALAAIEAKKSN